MANNLDAYVPEWWANETLAILREKMVVCNLVHRDFEPMFAQYGDTVNTRRPSEMKAIRKHKTTALLIQDATATNVPVVLDQHVHVAFNIHDLEQSFAFKALTTEYLDPAGLALARYADRVVLGQSARWIENALMVGDNTKGSYDNLVDANTYMTGNKAYEEGRNMIVAPKMKGKLLKNKELFPVQNIGTDDLVRRGMLGRLSDFDLYTCQNQMDTQLTTIAGKTGATTASSASAQGTFVVNLTANAGVTLAAGQSLIISGSPYIISSVSTLAITLTTALREPVLSGAVIWVLARARVTNVYPVGHMEEIAFTSGAGILDVGIGSIVRIGTKCYTIIETSQTVGSWYLDRALEDATTSAMDVTVFQGVQINFGFHRNALTTAIRPLAPVSSQMGVRSAVASFDGLTVRATMGYNMSTQNTQVTLDFLMGVKVLDLNLGVALTS